MVRSPQQVIENFQTQGISIADWARQHGFNPSLVYQVLKGTHVPVRGQSHKIAVTLGIKFGTIPEPVADQKGS
jgi:gp16 family phage-associated protein